MTGGEIVALAVAGIAAAGGIAVALINNLVKRRDADSPRVLLADPASVSTDRRDQANRLAAPSENARPTAYSPSSLASWRARLEAGHWAERIDCRDELLLQDLCSALSALLSARH